jgi:cysteine synthase
MRVAENVLELVGQTPMLRMRRLEQAESGVPSAEIWAKLEFLNPGGSVKDRAALGLVLDAERRGVLQTGGTWDWR